MNAQQLRNSILQEAIEGRLVPQDPNDEPASVLLERIREEKKRLVKEGKLKKKDLEETPISEDEIPFEIPDSWEWVRVKEVFSINPKVVADDNADAAFIPMEKIEACYGSRFSYEIRKWKTIKSSFTCFADGDVAFAKITPCFQNRKSMILKNLPNGIGAGTTELKVLRQYAETIVREYLLYFLASSYFIDEATFKGTANQQRIIVGYLENKLFPLPPLAEQKRIVAKIEELLPKVDEFGKAQETLNKLNEELPDRLKKSILQEAITGRLVPQDPNDEPASVLLDKIRKEKAKLVKEGKLKKKDLEETPISEDEIPFEIPDSWEWVRVKEVFSINPKVVADDNADAAFIPMEKIEACYGSRFSYEIRKWKTIKSSFTCFADGDVAFAKITPCFQNRKSMILKNLPNGIGAGTTELKVLRQYAETIVREYLLYFLASSYFIDEATFKGTANQQRIIVGYLENKLFPLPPLAEQKRIVAKIEDLFAVLDGIKESLEV